MADEYYIFSNLWSLNHSFDQISLQISLHLSKQRYETFAG